MIPRIAFVSDHEPVTTNFLRHDVFRLMYGVMLAARRANVRVSYFIHALPLGPFIEMHKKQKFDGAIFILKGFCPEACRQLIWIRKRIPCVACMVKPPVPGIPYIGTDIRRGFDEQIRRLLGHGHASFGYIGSFYGKHSIDRFLVVRDLLQAHKVPLEQRWVPGFSIANGAPRVYDRRMQRFLSDLPGDTLKTNTIMGDNAVAVIRAFFENGSFPNAVLSEYDHFAEAFYTAALGRGFAIPGTMALAGFGNEKYAFPPHGDTFLSTMHEDFTEIGKRCVQFLIQPGVSNRNAGDVLIPPVQIPGLSEFRGKPDQRRKESMLFKQAVQSTIAEESDAADLSNKLALKTGFSKKYFLQRFKETYHQPFREFVNNIRLERAASLLKDSSQSIITIAMQCGFNNIQPFNRLFKIRYGKTPTTFRG